MILNHPFRLILSNILMCVLLQMLICTVLRAHITVVEALNKINHYYFYYLQNFLALLSISTPAQTQLPGHRVTLGGCRKPTAIVKFGVYGHPQELCHSQSMKH